MSDAAICLSVLGVAIIVFLINVLPVDVVAVGVAIALHATGLLDLRETFAGFGDPLVVFVASLFVVSEGIDATGITAWASRRIESVVGDNRRRLLVVTMAIGACMSALISPNAAAAGLLPMSVMTAKRAGQSPSFVAMPLAFAVGAGALLLLTGSPVNVLVSEVATNHELGGFGFASFAWAGVPLVVGTIALTVLLAPRILPVRKPGGTTDLSRHAETLAEEYEVVPEAAVLSGARGLVELVVPPRSELIGEEMSEGQQTADGLELIAMTRDGERHRGKAVLRVGDTLLVSGPWERLEQRVRNQDVLVVDAPEQIRRQAVPMGPRAGRALAILLAMVVLLSLDVMPAAIVAVGAACAMVVTRVVRVEQAYHSISWTIVVLIAGMIPLSTAIAKTGAADLVGSLLVRTIGNGGPYAMMVGIFVVIAVLGQFISNTATALIVLPIALSSAAKMSVSPRPFLMLVAVAGAASLLTPIATPANMIVMGPGGYRFGDYWKLGAPLLVWYLVVCLVVIPLVWPF